MADYEIVIPATESPLAGIPRSVPRADLEEAFRRLVLLYRLGRHIASATTETKVFDAILSAVSEVLQIERAFVATISNGHLVPRAAHRAELGGAVSAWPLSKTMLHRVLAEGISVLTTDAASETQYGKQPSVNLNQIRSVMCCPLGAPGRPKGLVYVDNRAVTGAFARSDLEFLHALAHYGSLALEHAQERRAITEEKNLAEARLEVLGGAEGAEHEIIGDSQRIRELHEQIRRAARKDVSVVLVGETGTGKELVARALHTASSRAQGPFVAVNIRALPGTLLESELFGHEKGAFTGADSRRIGRLELARGGTLLIDEALDIPTDLQPKLLRVLEERVFQRLGGKEEIPLDVRVITACNSEPLEAVRQGLFRDDLYYRLATVTLEMPPLRERREDIVPLVHHFLRGCGSDKAFDDEALACLCAFPWPGNVRELKNCIEALDVMVDGPLIRTDDLPRRIRKPGSAEGPPPEFEPLAALVGRTERDHFRKALEIAQGRNEEAIHLLGISRGKFFQRKKEFGL